MRNTKPETKRIPIHQWTNDEGKVLVVRFVDEDWVRDEECGGGLHGWPWGLSLGSEKNVDYSKTWLVFACDPKDVIVSGRKVKARKGEVIFAGGWNECLGMTAIGLAAWASQSPSGVAANSGHAGVAANSRDRGVAGNSGFSGVAANSGFRGVAANSGHAGVAANSRDRGAAANSGTGGVAANSGTGGVAANSGFRGVAANSGFRGVAANSGDWGVAQTVGEEATIDLSATCLGSAAGRVVYWRVHLGAVLLVGWKKEDGTLGHALFDSAAMDLNEGERVAIRQGVIERGDK